MGKDKFDKFIDGKQVRLINLTNNNGVKIDIINYGAIVVSITVPDRNGKMIDVVLGYDSIDEYISGHGFFGATIGRFANRIGGGRFEIDGKSYQLAKNKGEDHLHGGNKGFNRVVWDAKELIINGNQAVELSYLSIDGEENYPGNLHVKLIYQLTQENELKLSYHATTDKSTVVNLTHHSYFNLSGAGNGTILNHQLKLYASHYTPTTKNQITTGEIKDVSNTSMDFRTMTTIGERIDNKEEQMIFGNGYDHNWIIDNDNKSIVLAAELYNPESGILMKVLTDQPGIQLYTSNYLDGSHIGKLGKAYHRRSAVCLETQDFPDAPNHPAFPSTILKPNQVYNKTCIYKFSIK